MKALIYIPVFNQFAELPRVLDEIAAEEFTDVDFLLVNNGSSDGSEELIRNAGHPYIDLPRNRGVGHSYIEALDWALDKGEHTFFGAMAGNGKMLASEVLRLLQPLRDRSADYVTGSRFLQGGAAPNLPSFRRNTIPVVNRIVWATTGQRVTDATNGFRAFRLELMRRASFNWHAEWLYTYGFEYFLYAKALRAKNVRCIEVATTMRYPPKGQRYSKIRPGRDWIAMLQPWVRARITPGGFR